MNNSDVENTLKVMVKSYGSIERIAEQLLRDVWSLEGLLSKKTKELNELKDKIEIIKSTVSKY